MVSGPDLGAGYLYQLSYEAEPPGPSFTFHAQEGGVDAAGPPVGPLGFLGYRFPRAPCMFGGPRCFERRFLLPEGELVRVRAAYNRTRFCMAAMLGHEYESVPVPASEGLQELLERCDPPLRAAGLRYRLVGRAAAFLRGGAEPPPSATIEAEPAAAERIGKELEPYLTEPVADRGPEEGFGGRAFLGTFQKGLRVEFGVPPAGAGTPSWETESVGWMGFDVPVARRRGP